MQIQVMQNEYSTLMKLKAYPVYIYAQLDSMQFAAEWRIHFACSALLQ